MFEITGDLWVRIGILKDRPQGLEWAPVGMEITRPVLAFDFGPKGTVFAANAAGKIFLTRGLSRQLTSGDDVWWEVHGAVAWKFLLDF